MIAFLLAQTIAITGGTVYPVSGPKIEHATVLIRDGHIVAVGANVTVPADATKIDATGKWVTPGLIDGAGQMGVTERGAGVSAAQGRLLGRADAAARGARRRARGAAPGAARPGAAHRICQPRERHAHGAADRPRVQVEADSRGRRRGLGDRERARDYGRAGAGRADGQHSIV